MTEVNRLKKIMEYEKELRKTNLSENEKTNIMLKILKLEKKNTTGNGMYIAFLIAWIPFILMVMFHLGKLK